MLNLIALQHTQWLNFINISGPFLSVEVLLETFPQGLDGLNHANTTLIRQVYQEWRDNFLAQEDWMYVVKGQKKYRNWVPSHYDPDIHKVWVKWVLENTLEYSSFLTNDLEQLRKYSHVVPENRYYLQADYLLLHPDTQKAVLLIKVVEPNQKLDSTEPKTAWKASIATKMREHLAGTGIQLGLITNGDQWMLISVPPEQNVSSYITWHANIWLEEETSLRSFQTLLGIRRFFSVAPEHTLPALLVASQNTEQSLTDQLGKQVRKAIEVLIQTIDRIDEDEQRILVKEVSDTELYQIALTVMMRLVFLLCAEEKGQLLLGNRIYDNNYAATTLRGELREVADQWGEELLARQYDAWFRLLSTFRAVYHGLDVEDPALYLPAYQGNLFDPDRYPILEGREIGQTISEANPLPVDNRTVLHLLEAIQIIRVRTLVGNIEPRKISFKTLDVEQIGQVYEGLLDHTVTRATKTVLGLKGGKKKEPEIALVELEELLSLGEETLITYLAKLTGRSNKGISLDLHKDYSQMSNFYEKRYINVCNNNMELWKRVRVFYGLIRLDTCDYPVILSEGSIYVTDGTDRRETGTHYTPKTLSLEVVKHTLEPLLYDRDGKLKSKEEILKLKICDLSMGSGAFLVQVCRYLGEKLIETQGITITEENETLLVDAKRLVSENCIYGVDKNPLAVEIAKLSIWLETLSRTKPFTFLDHALKCGDSLVGVTLKQLEYWDLDTSGMLRTTSEKTRNDIKEAIRLREEIQAFPCNNAENQHRKEYLLTQANARTNDLVSQANLLVLSYLAKRRDPSGVSPLWKRAPRGGSVKDRETLKEGFLLALQNGENIKQVDMDALPDIKPFHWELEFPEVFLKDDSKGFDALVGNPPFMGGQRITGNLGTVYRDYLIKWLANGTKGSADLCAYFFLRAKELLKEGSPFGLVATNTIAQGDTREVGLDQLVSSGSIYRAVSSRPWTGTASLEVSLVWFRLGGWNGDYYLDDKQVTGITTYLTENNKVEGNPYRLVGNEGKSFQGSLVLGLGFTMTPDEARELIERNPKNKDVLFPYINGEDLNRNYDQSPSRWVINFHSLPLSPDDNDDPSKVIFASNYPDCLSIVEEKVKPERDKNKYSKSAQVQWWLYERVRPELYKTIAPLKRVLVRARVSNINGIVFVPTDIVISDAVVVFPFDDYATFSLLQSMTHTEWLNYHSSTLGAGTRYTPSDCFETFPFPFTPPNPSRLSSINSRIKTL